MQLIWWNSCVELKALFVLCILFEKVVVGQSCIKEYSVLSLALGHICDTKSCTVSDTLKILCWNDWVVHHGNDRDKWHPGQQTVSCWIILCKDLWHIFYIHFIKVRLIRQLFHYHHFSILHLLMQGLQTAFILTVYIIVCQVTHRTTNCKLSEIIVIHSIFVFYIFHWCKTDLSCILLSLFSSIFLNAM